MSTSPRRWLRFADLKGRGVVNSWPALKLKIKKQGFPAGRMLGPNTRAWTEEEVVEWEDSRPIAGPDPRGAAKAPRGRPRKAETAAGKARAETTANP
jgi:hypothetical protein